MEVSSFTNLMLFNYGFNEFGYIIIHIAANYLHISHSQVEYAFSEKLFR